MLPFSEIIILLSCYLLTITTIRLHKKLLPEFDQDIWFVYCFPYLLSISSIFMWLYYNQTIYEIFIITFNLIIVYTHIIKNNENMLRYAIFFPKNKDESPLYLTYNIE